MAKKRREAPPKAVESSDDSEEESEDDDDEGVLGDEFEGASEEVENEEEGLGLGFGSESDEEEEEEGGPAVMKTIMEAAIGLREREEALRASSDVDSMEGSRSRSEEDLRDIGSARRLDDDDTGDSAWKEGAVAETDAEAAGGDENAGPSSSAAPDAVVEKEKSGGDGAVARVLDSEVEGGEVGEAMETDDEEDDEEGDEKEDEDGAGSGEAESQSEGEPSGSVSVQDGSDSDSGCGGKGEKDGSTKDSAYSRAFSKILKQSKVAKESDTGPVLAARQTLVARKLEEEAGETKEKKDTAKEKKELREKAHVYPQPYNGTKEKDLVKLATRGVVKLFNAVSKAQKVQAKSEARDSKVVAKESKSAFLAEVRGTGSSAAVGSKRKSSSASEAPFKFGTSESNNQPASRWSVVKDDFMLGKQKLKDWDKDEEMADVGGVQQLNNQIDDDSD